jgi:hypothetical protein
LEDVYGGLVKPKFSLLFFYLALLGFELRALHLLNRCPAALLL